MCDLLEVEEARRKQEPQPLVQVQAQAVEGAAAAEVEELLQARVHVQQRGQEVWQQEGVQEAEEASVAVLITSNKHL